MPGTYGCNGCCVQDLRECRRSQSRDAFHSSCVHLFIFRYRSLNAECILMMTSTGWMSFGRSWKQMYCLSFPILSCFSSLYTWSMKCLCSRLGFTSACNSISFAGATDRSSRLSCTQPRPRLVDIVCASLGISHLRSFNAVPRAVSDILTPRSNNVAEVTATIFYLCVVAHFVGLVVVHRAWRRRSRD